MAEASRDDAGGLVIPETPPKGKATEPLTIVHVCGYYAPGLGYQENKLPAAQAALGHDVHVVTADRYMPDPNYDAVYGGQLGPRIVGAGDSSDGAVRIHRLLVRFEIERRQNLLLAGSVKTIAGLAPDVIHLHGVTPMTTLAVLMSGLHRRAAIVVDHHLCQFNMEPATAAKRLYYKAFRNAVLPLLRRKVSAWLPINEDAAAVLRDWLGIAGRGVEISRLGADIGGLRPDADAGRAWRAAHGIPPSAALVVHAGKLSPRKEVVTLIGAFADVAPQDACLVIAGDGPHDFMAALKAEATRSGRDVRFLPPRPHNELPGLFNAADCGVWPGDAAVTLIEGMACGLPVILADPPGQHYVAGTPHVRFVPRGDRKATAAAIAATIDSADGYPDGRRRIAESIRAQLSWDVIGAELIDTYRRAIRSHTETGSW
ncbi:MAG: glycosyltransferase family 4 protein [Alphaproteobacteria bacterium]